PRAIAQLATRCPRGRPDADLRGAVGAFAECGYLCSRALQGACRGIPAFPSPLAHAYGLWVALGCAGVVLPLAPARHQAPVRLFLDRTHGDHHLRLRHGRAGRDLRRVAAYDRALAYEIGDLLCGRACGTEGRLAADGG